MAEYENFYTPDNIDEQIEAFLQIQEMSTRDQKLARALSAFYQPEGTADACSLERVLVKLLADDQQQHEHPIIPLSDFMPKQQQSQTLMPRSAIADEAKSQSRRTTSRRLEILVASIVLIILVGSMLTVFNAVHQSHMTAISSLSHAQTPTARPVPGGKLGQIIYKSDVHQLVLDLSWSPDGKRLAAFVDGTLQSWDATNHDNVVTYNIPATASGTKVFAGSFAWSPDSMHLAVSTAIGATIYVFDAKTAAIQASIHMPGSTQVPAQSGTPVPIPTPVPSPTPQPGSVGSLGAGKVILSRVQTLSAGPSFENMTWSPDGKFLAATYDGRPDSTCVICIWNVETGASVQTLNKGFNDYIRDFQWSPDGRYLAAHFVTSTLTIWDTVTWSIVKQYQGVYAFSWSPDGKHMALLDAGGLLAKNARIVDALSGQTLLTFAQEGQIAAIHWSPDGTRIALEYQKTPASLGFQKIADYMKLWDATNGKLLYTFTNSPVYEASWSPDSKYIACVSNDQRIIVLIAQ